MNKKLQNLIKTLSNLGLKTNGLKKLASSISIGDLDPEKDSSVEKPSAYRFFNQTSVSCGWISPEGKYYYNNMDHYSMINFIYKKEYRAKYDKIGREKKGDFDKILFEVYKDALLSGWIKVSNAFEISTGRLSKPAINGFIDLFLSYGDRSQEEKIINLTSKNYELIFSGTIFELEAFARRV